MGVHSGGPIVTGLDGRPRLRLVVLIYLRPSTTTLFAAGATSPLT
jgi:hypothetical protein